MHLPNDFLNPGTASALFGAAIGAFSLALAKVKTGVLKKVKIFSGQLATEPQTSSQETIRFTDSGKEKIYAAASVAALIFALQMVNFPIAGGTSGHFVGGALAFFILGPWSAIIVMTLVIAVQAIVFADGGLLAMGANIFNMGVLTVLTAYGVYLIKNKNLYIKIFISSFTSVLLAALGTSLVMVISGVTIFSLVAPIMLKYHLLIGLVEGLITLLILFLLRKYNYNLWSRSNEK